MAQDITLMGASYSAVPAVTLPKTGGGTASFTDVTDTTATASDVAQGKYFYLATGEKVVGTSSGGGTGGVTQDQDGYLVLDDEGGGGGGGGDSWSWMGRNPTKVHTITEHSTLSSLGVDEWTYSTSSSVLRSATLVDSSDSVTCNLSQYDYLVIVKVNVTYDYGDWSLSGAAENTAFSGGLAVYRQPIASRSDLENGTGVTSNLLSTNFYVFYTNTSGVEVGYTSRTGVYTDTVSTSYSGSGSISNRAMTFRKPSISITGNTNSFTQEAFAHLDTSKSFYDLLMEVWRVDAGTSSTAGCYRLLPDILTNGLEVTS